MQTTNLRPVKGEWTLVATDPGFIRVKSNAISDSRWWEIAVTEGGEPVEEVTGEKYLGSQAWEYADVTGEIYIRTDRADDEFAITLGESGEGVGAGGGEGGGPVSWAQVTNKPAFKPVATSGDYNDLTNLPTIPSEAGFDRIHYAQAGGEQAGNGMINSPYNSLAAAVEAAGAGDVVFLLPGTFEEDVTVDKNLIITAHGGPGSASATILGTVTHTAALLAIGPVRLTHPTKVPLIVNGGGMGRFNQTTIDVPNGNDAIVYEGAGTNNHWYDKCYISGNVRLQQTVQRPVRFYDLRSTTMHLVMESDAAHGVTIENSGEVGNIQHAAGQLFINKVNRISGLVSTAQGPQNPLFVVDSGIMSEEAGVLPVTMHANTVYVFSNAIYDEEASTLGIQGQLASTARDIAARFTPSNYTPDNASVLAHLRAIDLALANIGEGGGPAPDFEGMRWVGEFNYDSAYERGDVITYDGRPFVAGTEIAPDTDEPGSEFSANPVYQDMDFSVAYPDPQYNSFYQAYRTGNKPLRITGMRLGFRDDPGYGTFRVYFTKDVGAMPENPMYIQRSGTTSNPQFPVLDSLFIDLAEDSVFIPPNTKFYLMIQGRENAGAKGLAFTEDAPQLDGFEMLDESGAAISRDDPWVSTQGQSLHMCLEFEGLVRSWEPLVTFPENNLNLAQVAYSGDYNDLQNLPTPPEPTEPPEPVVGPKGDKGLVWTGPHQPAREYVVDEAVQHNGSSYIATEPNVGSEPGVLSAATDVSYLDTSGFGTYGAQSFQVAYRNTGKQFRLNTLRLRFGSSMYGAGQFVIKISSAPGTKPENVVADLYESAPLDNPVDPSGVINHNLDDEVVIEPGQLFYVSLANVLDGGAGGLGVIFEDANLNQDFLKGFLDVEGLKYCFAGSEDWGNQDLAISGGTTKLYYGIEVYGETSPWDLLAKAGEDLEPAAAGIIRDEMDSFVAYTRLPSGHQIVSGWFTVDGEHPDITPGQTIEINVPLFLNAISFVDDKYAVTLDMTSGPDVFLQSRVGVRDVTGVSTVKIKSNEDAPVVIAGAIFAFSMIGQWQFGE